MRLGESAQQPVLHRVVLPDDPDAVSLVTKSSQPIGYFKRPHERAGL